MPAYEATIQLKVQGQDRLKYVLDSVEKINQITSRLKPVNLTSPGRGSGGDAIRVLKTELDNFSRAVVNFKPEGISKRAKELSKTLAGSAAQADALVTALENVGLETGGFSKQSAEVKNYSLALLEAEKNAKRLAVVSDQIRRGARVAQIAARFGVSPEDVEKRLTNLREIRYKKDREADAARYFAQKREEDFEIRLQKIRERNAARTAAQEERIKRTRQLNESLALGVGFPLLFGAGPGSVLGSLAGSFAGKGFGGQILGGAIGAAIDEFVVKIATVTSSLEKTTEAAGISGTATESYIEALKQSGQEAAAMQVATEALARVVGDDGVRALQDFEAAGTKLANAFTKLGTQILALIADLAGPTVQGIAGAVESTVLFRQAGASGDEKQQADLARLRNAYGDEYYDILDRILKRQRELNAAVEDQAIAQQAIAVAQVQAYQQALATTDVAKLDYEIAVLGGDIENEKVAALMRQKIEREFSLQSQQLITELTKEGADFTLVTTKLLALQAQYKAAIAGLELKIKTAQESSAKSAAKAAEAEQKRIATLQAQLNTSTALLAIDKQIAAAKVDGDKAKLAELEYTRALEASELKLAEIRARGLGEAQTQLQIQIEENRLETELVKIDAARALERQKLQEAFQTTIEGLELELASSQALTREELNRLEIEKKRLALRGNKNLTPEQREDIIKLEESLQKERSPLKSFITDGERQLKDLEQVAVNVSKGIGNAIANSMSQGIVGLIEGTKNAQQIFADFLKSVGDILIQEGTRMIAMYIAIGIAKAFAGLASGGSGGGNSYSGGNVSTDAFNSGGIPGLSNTASISGDFFSGVSAPSFTPFASGGFVTGPTRAVVGEGGQSEYVIPANKMGSAMSRWNAGVRGDSVVSGAEATGGAGGVALAEAPTNIVVEGGVLNFNDSQYIRQDQVPAIVKQASAAGEAKALRKLQMSTATRKRIGL